MMGPEYQAMKIFIWAIVTKTIYAISLFGTMCQHFNWYGCSISCIFKRVFYDMPHIRKIAKLFWSPNCSLSNCCLCKPLCRPLEHTHPCTCVCVCVSAVVCDANFRPISAGGIHVRLTLDISGSPVENQLGSRDNSGSLDSSGLSPGAPPCWHLW